MRAISLAIVTTVVATSVLVACGGSEPSGHVRNGPATGDAVRIVAGDSFFEPDSVTVPAQQQVTLEITNEGDIPHDFSIEGLDVSTGAIQPGEIKTITLEPKEGTFEFVCLFHGGMSGTLESS